jgi:hypothetical protein
MDPCRFGHVLHDRINVRLGENDGGSVVVVSNADAGLTILQVIDVSTSTLKRWQRKPEFAKALAAAQAEIFSSVCNEVRQLGMDATKALGEVVRSTTAPAAARTRAAGLVIALLLRIHSAETQEARLAAIEKRLDAHDRKGRLSQ